MNLLLLDEKDITGPNTAVISDERLQHVITVLSSKLGDTLSVGLINGNMGKALITALDTKALHLQFVLDKTPPAPLPLTVVLALPRPKMLRRIVHNIAEFGIKELHLIHSFKVEKSYWQTPWLDEAQLNAFLLNGLSEAKDTVLPKVFLHKRFKPFVEDTLPLIIDNKEAFIAHPYCNDPMPCASSNERVIVIGPEGGFTPYEVDLIRQQGVNAFHMGERIYKVENALTLLSGQLSIAH